MTSLILTVISIVLLGAISVVTINYLPSWSRDKADTTAVVRESVERLERGFQLHAQAHGGVAAPVQPSVDGGIASNFTPSFLPFVPAAIAGYRWVYGTTDASAAPPYQNTAYFCMTPVSFGAVTGEGKVRGALGALQFMSDEQAFVAPGCGATATASYSSFPAAMSFTYFVRHVPGQH
jgi:hypothetical protein